MGRDASELHHIYGPVPSRPLGRSLGIVLKRLDILVTAAEIEVVVVDGRSFYSAPGREKIWGQLA